MSLKKNKPSKIIIFVLIFLLIVLAVLLIIEYGANSYFYNLFKEPKLFVIHDECSLILSNIIHQIKDEGGCRIMCSGECEVREMRFHDFEFISQNESCHICNCYCI
jgi:hypothetical protein